MEQINTWMLQAYVEITSTLTSALKREEGQDLVEYALIIGLVSAAAVVALMALGGQISTLVGKVGTALGGATFSS